MFGTEEREEDKDEGGMASCGVGKVNRMNLLERLPVRTEERNGGNCTELLLYLQ